MHGSLQELGERRVQDRALLGEHGSLQELGERRVQDRALLGEHGSLQDLGEWRFKLGRSTLISMSRNPSRVLVIYMDKLGLRAMAILCLVLALLVLDSRGNYLTAEMDAFARFLGMMAVEGTLVVDMDRVSQIGLSQWEPQPIQNWNCQIYRQTHRL